MPKQQSIKRASQFSSSYWKYANQPAVVSAQHFESRGMSLISHKYKSDRIQRLDFRTTSSLTWIFFAQLCQQAMPFSAISWILTLQVHLFVSTTLKFAFFPALHCSHLPSCLHKYLKFNLDRLLLFLVNSQYSDFQAITLYVENMPRTDFPLNCI